MKRESRESKLNTEIGLLRESLNDARRQRDLAESRLSEAEARIKRYEVIIQFLGGWVERLAIKHGKTDTV